MRIYTGSSMPITLSVRAKLHGKEAPVKKSFFVRKDLVMFDMLRICPVVQCMVRSPNKHHQHNKADDTNNRNTGRNCFAHPSEGNLPSTPRKRRSADKEHGGICH